MGVPTDPQDLQSSNLVIARFGVAIELHHVLLQWIHSEDVLHLEVLHLAIGALGMNHEPVTVSKQPVLQSVMLEDDIVEIADHAFVGCHIHGQIMVRTFECQRFGLMAFDAGISPDISGNRGFRQTGEIVRGNNARDQHDQRDEDQRQRSLELISKGKKHEEKTGKEGEDGSRPIAIRSKARRDPRVYSLEAFRPLCIS